MKDWTDRIEIRLLVLAESNAEGLIELLSYIRDEVLGISDAEYEMNGDSKVVKELDNLSDRIQEEIDEENEILSGIRESISKRGRLL